MHAYNAAADSEDAARRAGVRVLPSHMTIGRSNTPFVHIDLQDAESLAPPAQLDISYGAAAWVDDEPRRRDSFSSVPRTQSRDSLAARGKSPSGRSVASRGGASVKSSSTRRSSRSSKSHLDVSSPRGLSSAIRTVTRAHMHQVTAACGGCSRNNHSF